MTHSTQDVTTLLELLASRICHDLVSPVGAINNGIEFMEDMANDPDGIKQATDLIAHSAAAAGARLQSFRIAYGAGGRDGNLKPEDIQKAFGALVRVDGKIRQSWDPYAPLGIDMKATGACKILMGALLLAQECLPKGGTVFADPGTGKELLITAEGTDATVRENVEQALAGILPVSELDPRLVHPHILGESTRSYNFTIMLHNTTENKIVWSIKQPE
ncbi:MAG: hypothetical protein KDJ26_04310 [Alphaproteobacteria bacterium]|nr:hypothetical protein [Alphaproteobacteria bacterium]MCB1551207.1 hypothetical protein [Alphaproteobacteria bacterium]MCB9985221.1 hypothetical protein [Micavibrio sp.]HPQ51041.1 histidine phosphotransferase family protein [Alphaproteobacteria bacterium]HRK98108.1 histidine phosphotransferase family protein [Alphaproteobacteria bacterium]